VLLHLNDWLLMEEAKPVISSVSLFFSTSEHDTYKWQGVRLQIEGENP
jgi:hypothetical protein